MPQVQSEIQFTIITNPDYEWILTDLPFEEPATAAGFFWEYKRLLKGDATWK